jgi:hypothetical protein
MEMHLRLTEAETNALRATAEQEGRSMQEVARAAIAQYVSERPDRVHTIIGRLRSERREVLDRLGE